MSKVIRLGLMLGILAFVFSPSAHASEMGVCTDWSWVPSSPTCTVATGSLDIGAASSNPTFYVALNGGGSTDSTDMVILVPQTSTSTVSSLSFSATFTPSSGGSAVSQTVSALSSPYTTGNLVSFLGLNSANGSGANRYSFGAINDHEVVSGTMAYSVYYIPSSLGLTGGSGYVQVSFSNFNNSGFPVGTMFFALGDVNNGEIKYVTPYTLAGETVPEPMSLILFGTGLLGIALLVRRRTHKEGPEPETSHVPNAV